MSHLLSGTFESIGSTTGPDQSTRKRRSRYPQEVISDCDNLSHGADDLCPAFAIESLPAHAAVPARSTAVLCDRWTSSAQCGTTASPPLSTAASKVTGSRECAKRLCAERYFPPGRRIAGAAGAGGAASSVRRDRRPSVEMDAVEEGVRVFNQSTITWMLLRVLRTCSRGWTHKAKECGSPQAMPTKARYRFRERTGRVPFHGGARRYRAQPRGRLLDPVLD